jgi:hypothetical protein
LANKGSSCSQCPNPVAHPVSDSDHHDCDHKVFPNDFPRWFALRFCDGVTQNSEHGQSHIKLTMDVTPNETPVRNESFTCMSLSQHPTKSSPAAGPPSFCHLSLCETGLCYSLHGFPCGSGFGTHMSRSAS